MNAEEARALTQQAIDEDTEIQAYLDKIDIGIALAASEQKSYLSVNKSVLGDYPGKIAMNLIRTRLLANGFTIDNNTSIRDTYFTMYW